MGQNPREEERQRREARRLRFLTDTIVDRSERDGGGEVTETMAFATCQENCPLSLPFSRRDSTAPPSSTGGPPPFLNLHSP